ncbi:MAG: GNAT family N-acetyltransferase [Myxococcaceae bacterium]|nr:GNAT family N-acetyltransferase [Myxococcaceae bacterium]
MPVIREAVEADDAAVGELLVRAFVESYARKLPDVVVGERRKADLRDVRSKRGVAKVWVAEERGEIVGTVAMWAPGAKGSEAWLSNAFDLRHLAVSEQRRGSGLAGRLLDVAEAYARAAGGAAVCLHVRREASGVADVYVKRGYRRAPEGDLDFLPEVFLEAYVLAL